MFIVPFIKVCFGNNVAKFEIQCLTKIRVQRMLTCGVNVFKNTG